MLAKQTATQTKFCSKPKTRLITHTHFKYDKGLQRNHAYHFSNESDPIPPSFVIE